MQYMYHETSSSSSASLLLFNRLSKSYKTLSRIESNLQKGMDDILSKPLPFIPSINDHYA